MKFKKVGAMDQGNPKYKCRLGRDWIESSPEENVLGELVDENPTVSQQCVCAAQRVNCILCCIKGSVTSSSIEVNLHFHCILLRYNLQYCAQF